MFIIFEIQFTYVMKMKLVKKLNLSHALLQTQSLIARTWMKWFVCGDIAMCGAWGR